MGTSFLIIDVLNIPAVVYMMGSGHIFRGDQGIIPYAHDVISGDHGPEVTGRGGGQEVDIGYDRKWTLVNGSGLKLGTNKDNMGTL